MALTPSNRVKALMQAIVTTVSRESDLAREVMAGIELDSITKTYLKRMQNYRCIFQRQVMAVVKLQPPWREGDESMKAMVLRMLGEPWLTMDCLAQAYRIPVSDSWVSVRQLQLFLLHVLARMRWQAEERDYKYQNNALLYLCKATLCTTVDEKTFARSSKSPSKEKWRRKQAKVNGLHKMILELIAPVTAAEVGTACRRILSRPGWGESTRHLDDAFRPVHRGVTRVLQARQQIAARSSASPARAKQEIEAVSSASARVASLEYELALRMANPEGSRTAGEEADLMALKVTKLQHELAALNRDVCE
jgi:hypothetical protein